MDLLSQRYANPFFMLDEFIRLGQFREFVLEISKTIIEERQTKYRWEFFLHKVFDKSYDDFEKSVKQEELPHMTKEDVESIIQENESVFNLF